MIKFLIAVMAVVAFCFAATSVMADHDYDKGANATPYTLAVVEFDVLGNGWLNTNYGPWPFPNQYICQSRGNQLEAMLHQYASEMRFALACIHPTGGKTFDEVVQMVIRDYRKYFIQSKDA